MIVPSKGWSAYTYTVTALLIAIAVFSFPESTSKIVAHEAVATPASFTRPTPISPPQTPTTTVPVQTSQVNPPPDVLDPNKPFEGLTILGKAGYVYDATDGKTLFAKNEDSQMPLASITKIMTAITALEISTSSTSTILISPEALAVDGDTGLLAHESWDLRELLAYTLVVSSNDGAAAIAESFTGDKKYFVNEMNRRAQAIGLSRGWFHNESGLDESSNIAGGYGSAKDVYKLMKYALTKHSGMINSTTQPTITATSEDGFDHTGKNTNIIASKVPNLLASKTGYSGLAGGNLAIVFKTKNDHTITVVVLGSSYDGRFTDVQKLVEATIKQEALTNES